MSNIPSNKRYSVLLVCGEDMRRETYSHRLAQRGINVAALKSGKVALTTLAVEHFDLIIADRPTDIATDRFASGVHERFGVGTIPLFAIVAQNEITQKAALAQLGGVTQLSPTIDINALIYQIERTLHSISDKYFPQPANKTLKPVKDRYFILIVDDEPMNREVLRRRLIKDNYVVNFAESGKEALKMLRNGHFDLILLDIMMPEMDGYEVLANIRANQAWADIPVIMVTALTSLDSVQSCRERGATDYVVKPFNYAVLKEKVRIALGRK